jgi:hypothetical protein
VSVIRGIAVDNNDGTYTATVNSEYAGLYELHNKVVIGGGLKGHYYDDTYFSVESLDMTRIDKTVDFNWYNSRVTNNGVDFVSVYWEGHIKPDVSGVYVIDVEFDDNARLYVDEVLLIDSWDRAPGRSSCTVSLNSDVYHSVVLQYREIRGTAHCKLSWSSPPSSLNLARATIPSRNLYYSEEVLDSPANYTVIPSTPSGERTTLSGASLHSGTAGKVSTFVIHSKDVYGNSRGMHDIGYEGANAYYDYDYSTVNSNDPFVAVATLVDDYGRQGYGNDVIPVTVAYDFDRRVYACEFVATVSGSYRLDVVLNDRDNGGGVLNYDYIDDVTSSEYDRVYGSPFTVEVAPGVTHARLSDVYGGYGNCPGTSGAWDVSGSNGDNWADWTADECDGFTHGMTGVEQYFYIRERDAFHNSVDRHDGGDRWDVVAHCIADGVAFEGTVEATSSPGEYKAMITPLKKGRYYLDVTLNGVHAKGSPFQLYVRHNEANENSYIVDYDTMAHATASGYPTVNIFYLQLSDSNENNLEMSGSPYTTTASVTITSDPSNAVVDETAALLFIGDGTVKVSYTPTTIGDNTLNIVVNGNHILGSPFIIHVLPGDVVGTSTTATGTGLTSAIAGREAEFIIQSRDLTGNPRDSSTDTFTVLLTMNSLSSRPADYDTMIDDLWGSAATVTGVVTYTSNGQYRVNYNATVSGTYTMDVKESDGSHISGSPFSPVVTPNVASGTESGIHGTGTRTGVAGSTALVEVYTRDVFGNYLLTAGDKIKCTAKLTSTHQSDWQRTLGATGTVVNGIASSALIGEVESVYEVNINVVSLGSSRYSCDYTPAYAGDYTLDATLETPGGLWGSFYRTDNFAPSKLSLTRHDTSVDFDWGLYSTVASSADPGIFCSGATGNADDPLTTTFDESKCEGNGLALPQDYFSVKWVGFLEAEHDEEYELGVVCDTGSSAGVTIGGVEVVPFGACGGVGKSPISGKLLMTAFARAAIEVKYSHSTRESSVQLLWTSPSQGPWAKIDSGRLFRDIAIDQVYTPTYTPNIAASVFTTAIGPSVTGAVAGVTQTFTVECRDAFAGAAFGNLQLAGGGCQIAAIGRGASGSAADATFEGTVTDNNDGTYLVTYHPESSGSYYFSITAVVAGDDLDVGWYHYDQSVQSNHIAGSPFILRVEPGEVKAAESHIDVLYVEDAIVGQESQVDIWARDVWANRKLVGGDSFEIFLADSSVGDTFGHADGDRNVYGTVIDNNDGTYSGSFTPGTQSGVSGDWQVRLFVNEGGVRTECKGSPYAVTIWPSEPAAAESYIKSGESSKILTVVNSGSRNEINSFTASTNSLRTWYLQAADVHGNDWWVGGSDFVARVRGSTNEASENMWLDVTDVGDGSYKVEMKLTVAGDYEIDVGLAMNANAKSKQGVGVASVRGGGGLLGKYFNNQHLRGSPVIERVDPTVDFSWAHGLITNTAVDFVSVEWTGYVKCPANEDVEFELANVDDYARLFIEDVLVIDTSTGVTSGKWPATANMLYKIKIEYFETQESASIVFYWKSMSMQRHKVPRNWLFSEVEPIQGSPFQLTVT